MENNWNQYFYYKGGKLYWDTQPVNNRVKIGDLAGYITAKGYIRVSVNGKEYFAHRIIWEMHHGLIPDGMFIDHIDGDRINNLLENLRLTDQRGNSTNSQLYKSNNSGYKGVSKSPSGNYTAKIRVDNKLKHLGTFSTPEEAARAYDEMAVNIHGEFAKTNLMLNLLH